jgi:hypothetical protein
MVSNHRREADHHPPLFFIFSCVLFLLLKPFAGYTQKIKGQYVSSMQQKGMLYFIRPQKGFKNKDLGSRLTYDITCFSGADSLTFNLSYFDKNNWNLDSLCLQMPEQKSTVALSKIFVDTKNACWHYRFSSRMAFKDLEKFFGGNGDRAIQLIQKDKTVLLKCSKRRWKKNASVNTRIFQLIQYNK